MKNYNIYKIISLLLVIAAIMSSVSAWAMDIADNAKNKLRVFIDHEEVKFDIPPRIIYLNNFSFFKAHILKAEIGILPSPEALA